MIMISLCKRQKWQKEPMSMRLGSSCNRIKNWLQADLRAYSFTQTLYLHSHFNKSYDIQNKLQIFRAKEVAGKSSSSGMGRGNLVEMLQKAENNQTETR